MSLGSRTRRNGRLRSDAKISPINYGGPLVNIEGQIQGVLVPASPQAEGETAGFEWYDSGIGFAMPLEDIYRVLPRMKSGKDLNKGARRVAFGPDDKTIIATFYNATTRVFDLKTGNCTNAGGFWLKTLDVKIDGDEILVGVWED